jgi:ribosomal protein S27E
VSSHSNPQFALPAAGERLRCGGCGNLTRFDVVSTRRTAAFWHYSVAGELTIEEERGLEASAEEVRCRWCGSTTQVELVPALWASAGAETAEQ